MKFLTVIAPPYTNETYNLFKIGEIISENYYCTSFLSPLVIDSIIHNEIMACVINNNNQIIYIIDHQNINQWLEKYSILL